MRKLYIAKSSIAGQGVFAGKKFKKGAIIIDFTGPILHRSKVKISLMGSRDHYFQISPTHFMGPSYQADDFINHSCDPNAGLRFREFSITLLAIRVIAKKEEITWDYSTTMHGHNWQMKCGCGSAKCRGVVRDFDSLPPATKRRYFRLGILPPYLRQKPRN